MNFHYCQFNLYVSCLCVYLSFFSYCTKRLYPYIFPLCPVYYPLTSPYLYYSPLLCTFSYLLIFFCCSSLSAIYLSFHALSISSAFQTFQHPFYPPLSLYSHIVLSSLSLLIILHILLLPLYRLPSPALFHFSLIFMTPYISCRFLLCHLSISNRLDYSLCTPFILTSQSQHPSCLVSSLQSPGVAGPPLPRSAPAGLCQLAAGPLPALHLHHHLLQHLERSQDVWKGN